MLALVVMCRSRFQALRQAHELSLVIVVLSVVFSFGDSKANGLSKGGDLEACSDFPDIGAIEAS